MHTMVYYSTINKNEAVTHENPEQRNQSGFVVAWLSEFTFTFHFHALEEEMATHSSVLAWRIPGTAGPCRLPSMGLHRVGHNWSDLAAAAAVLGGKEGGRHKREIANGYGIFFLKWYKVLKLWWLHISENTLKTIKLYTLCGQIIYHNKVIGKKR